MVVRHGWCGTAGVPVLPLTKGELEGVSRKNHPQPLLRKEGSRSGLPFLESCLQARDILSPSKRCVRLFRRFGTCECPDTSRLDPPDPGTHKTVAPEAGIW